MIYVASIYKYGGRGRGKHTYAIWDTVKKVWTYGPVYPTLKTAKAEADRMNVRYAERIAAE